jgi:hypothetical protein
LVAHPCPHPADQGGGAIHHQLAFFRRQVGLVEQIVDGFGFVAQPCGGNARACGFGMVR